MRDYRTEFPDIDPATMPAIPSAWLDTSWHNDTCPSFECGALRIFVDHANAADREIPEAPRYSVHLWEGDYPALLATDDWEALLPFVTRHERAAPCHSPDMKLNTCTVHPCPHCMLERATAICEAREGYGTPAYRGDPYEAVALQRQAAAMLGGAA